MSLELSRDVVVLGASLGGVQALCQLVSRLPGGFRGCLIIVLHTSPRSPRLLADILGRYTSLSVVYARPRDPVEPGRIYIAPPMHHLVIGTSGRLQLSDGPKENFSKPAVDPLFRSAARVFGPRVIGVVLTGGDGDGTAGLRAIKAAGGISIVQDPAEAADPGMPSKAIEGDHPDYIVTLKEIPGLLVSIANAAGGEVRE